MSPPQRRGSRPLVRRIVTRSQALLGEQFSAPKPSFRHAPPSFLVLGLAGRSGHQLAFGGMLQKLVRWVDRDHYSFSFFTPRSPLLEYRHWRSEQAAREIAVLEFSDRIEARTWAANKTRTPRPTKLAACEDRTWSLSRGWANVNLNVLRTCGRISGENPTELRNRWGPR